MDPLKVLTPEEVAETLAEATSIEGGPANLWSKRTMAEVYSDGPMVEAAREDEGVLDPYG